MKKVFVVLMSVFFVFGLFSLAQAGKPQEYYCSDDGGEWFRSVDDCDAACEATCLASFLGNGFPSGPHFNLNIKAKNDSFNCPTPTEPTKGYCTNLPGDPEPGKSDVGIVGSIEDCNLEGACDGTCIAVFSNVINMPQAGIANNSKLLMESGQAGSKGKAKKALQTPGYPDLLEVTDACLGFEANDNAAFRIPADAEGYAVYARTTGDPKFSPSFDFSDPEFYYVQNIDDPTNLEDDYLLLGYISQGGVFDVGGGAISIPPKVKGNKLPKATEITSLFMWTGEVCFLYDDGGVQTDKCCTDPSDPEYFVGTCVDPTLGTIQQCCYDDGTYDDCGTPLEGPSCSPGYVLTDVPICGSGEFPAVAYCNIYGDDPATQDVEDSEWVFNIADFVGLFFKLDNDGNPTGSSLLQVRFYPLPLNEGDPE